MVQSIITERCDQHDVVVVVDQLGLMLSDPESFHIVQRNHLRDAEHRSLQAIVNECGDLDRSLSALRKHVQLADGRIGQAVSASSVDAASTRFLQLLELNISLHHRISAARVEDCRKLGGIHRRRRHELSCMSTRIALKFCVARLGLARSTGSFLSAFGLLVSFVSTPAAYDLRLIRLLLRLLAFAFDGVGLAVVARRTVRLEVSRLSAMEANVSGCLFLSFSGPLSEERGSGMTCA